LDINVNPLRPRAGTSVDCFLSEELINTVYVGMEVFFSNVRLVLESGLVEEYPMCTRNIHNTSTL
jgi:hypothetical protein